MSSPYKGHAMEAVDLKSTLIKHGLLSRHDDAAGWLMQAIERAYRAGRDAGLEAAARHGDAAADAYEKSRGRAISERALTSAIGVSRALAKAFRAMKGGDEG